MQNSYPYLNNNTFGQNGLLGLFLQNNYSSQLDGLLQYLQQQQQIPAIPQNDFTKSLQTGLGTLDLLGGFAGGLMNLWSAYQGIQLANKKMALLDKQMGIAQEQWDNTKKEIEYNRKARTAIANQFNGVS